MENRIRHEGIIEAVDGAKARVRILQVSACAGCKIASHCHTSDSKEKIVDVDIAGRPQQWHVGQSVVVSTQSTMAGKALLIGFGLPLLLMMAVLVACMAAGCGEGITALFIIFALVPYYIIVWLRRDNIARQITFRLEETNE